MDDIIPPERAAGSLEERLELSEAHTDKDISSETENSLPKETSDESGSNITADLGSKKSSSPEKKPHKKNPVEWFKGLSHKQKFMCVGIAVGLLLAVVGGVFFILHKPKPAPAKVAQQPAPAPEPPKTTEPSKLSGVEVPLEKNKLPVIGIMIENSPDARPQSGLTQAGVVFEAIAEGGITRFLALFQENQPEYVGPVRSVRPYYLDWVQGFDAPIAHVGGSADALAALKRGGYKDLDQFANSSAYWRVSNRYAPHNMYTSLPKLVDVANQKKFVPTNFDSIPRKAEQASAAPTAKSIDLALSGFLYNAHFDYDTPSNSYKRSEANKPHVDEKSGQQISPKVVIACVAQYQAGYNGVNSAYNSVGEGKVYVFQDGVSTEGTWKKTSGKNQITFTSADGKPIKLNPGQTWITFVSGAGNVVVK